MYLMLIDNVHSYVGDGIMMKHGASGVQDACRWHDELIFDVSQRG